MNTSDVNINTIKDIYHNKENQKQYKLLSLLFEYETIDKIPSDKKSIFNNIPRIRQSINKKLQDDGYHIEKLTYRIQKVRENSVATLIQDVENFLKNHNRKYDIEKIRIFNSCPSLLSQNLKSVVKQFSEINCDIEFVTILSSSTEKILSELINNSNKQYFKAYKLNSYFMTNKKIFYILIETKLKKWLFYFDDNKNQYLNEVLKDDSPIYIFLDSIYTSLRDKPLKLDKVQYHIKKEEVDSLLFEILNKVDELQQKMDNKEKSLYQLLEKIFQRQFGEEEPLTA